MSYDLSLTSFIILLARPLLPLFQQQEQETNAKIVRIFPNGSRPLWTLQKVEP